MLERLASVCFRHRWRVIALWGVGLVALLTASGTVGGAFADGGRLPGTDSQRAYDLMSDEMPDRSGDTATVVFHDPAGVDRPSTVAAIRSYLDEVRSQPGVASVSSPVETTSQVAAAGTVAFATVDLLPDGPVPSEQAAAAIAEGIERTVHDTEADTDGDECDRERGHQLQYER